MKNRINITIDGFGEYLGDTHFDPQFFQFRNIRYVYTFLRPIFSIMIINTLLTFGQPYRVYSTRWVGEEFSKENKPLPSILKRFYVYIKNSGYFREVPNNKTIINLSGHLWLIPIQIVSKFYEIINIDNIKCSEENYSLKMGN